MKVAFVGKGGSGKTTLSALFARYLAGQWPVWALDADINQHMAPALGIGELAETMPTLGDHMSDIKEYLRGNNPRISSAAAMVKTTPPGKGSRLLTFGTRDPLLDKLFVDHGKYLRFARTGPFTEDDLGVACYHSKVGAVELLLNHTVDGPGEYVVVDMTAGADSFASGLFTRFDVTFLVCEPTVRSVGVYRQYVNYARDYDVKLLVVGNKVEDESDADFLRQHVGNDLLACFGRSRFVKIMERGQVPPLGDLESENLAVLQRMQQVLDATPKDWVRFLRQAHEFHVRNAKAWANERTGEDLANQIDPDFEMGPQVVQ